MSGRNITFSQLRVFAAVVEAGSFTGAARALRMTQPGVSHTISALEREFGLAVISRDRGGVALTEFGERAIVHAREVLDLVERLGQEASASVGLMAGRVKIGSFPSAASRILPSLVADFKRLHPGIEVALVEGTDEEVKAMIQTGGVDVGFVSLPVGNLETFSIAEDEMLAIIPEDHALAKRESVSMDEFLDEPFIMSKGGCEPLINEAFRSGGLEPKTSFEARDITTILAMVGEGLGVSMAPKLALPENHHAIRGVEIMGIHPAIPRRLGLAVRRAKSMPPATREFIKQAEKYKETAARTL